jgi:hypothetical protein
MVKVWVVQILHSVGATITDSDEFYHMTWAQLLNIKEGSKTIKKPII